MFGRNFPCPVLKLPRRIGKYGSERSSAHERDELVPDGRKRIDRFGHHRIVLLSAALASTLDGCGYGADAAGRAFAVVD
jgi:hypothetical protein